MPARRLALDMDQLRPWSSLPSATMGWKSPTRGAVDASQFVTLLRASPFALFPPGCTPASDARLPVFAASLYLGSLLTLRALSPPRFARSPWFVALAAAHNAALCLASLAMLAGVLRAIAVEVTATGSLASTLCNPRGSEMSASLTHWLYLFYLSKFWELVDTVILVLRGRPLTLLHVWHHTSVMFEMYSWLESNMALGVYGMVCNTLVHTFMYSYYCAALLKIRVPWKQALTSLQIVQFLVSFASLVPYGYYYRSTPGGCTGGPGLAASVVCNGSFLALFVDFYRKTYTADADGTKKSK